MIRLLFILSLILATESIAQVQPSLSTKSKKAIELYTEADNFRVRGLHPEAIDLLNQAISKDKNFIEAYYRLGLVYMAAKNYEAAIMNFEKGLSLTTDPKIQKVIWYDLGESYLLTGQYENASKIFADFLKVETVNKLKIDKARLLLQNAEFGLKNQAIKSQYRNQALSNTVNCFPTQYFPVLTVDQQELIYTRRLGSRDENDEDLVVARKDNEGNWIAPVSISANINSLANEGTCTISADGRRLIFTSCSGRRVFGSCDLFQSIKIGDEWTTPVNLGQNINSVDWESQPSLSADGRTLYFVSDRRGGFGRNDIWVSTMDDNGNWTKAKNLGAPVNTIYNEMSPFIHANSKTLYFASNGLVGFGGYDIFYSELGESTWSQPVNLGSPVNDHEDQFSLFITADGKTGFYSHEEKITKSASEALTISRIYQIDIPENQQVKFKSNFVKGIVTDSNTGKPLKAKIELFDISRNKIVSLVESDSITGAYVMVLTEGSEYALYANKRSYLFKSLNFNYSQVSDFKPLIIDIMLDPAVKGSVSTLNNIFFDVDKFDLKEKSITELDKVVRFLRENPQIRVEIGGHTDNTGSAEYNKQLSEKRAFSVYSFIINQGIEAKRLIYKGFGQSKPLKPNDTEDGRQFNRRIEFAVL